MVAIEIPGEKRNLNMNINAQQVIAASEASGIIFLTALDLKIFIIRDDLLNPQCIGQ